MTRIAEYHDKLYWLQKKRDHLQVFLNERGYLFSENELDFLYKMKNSFEMEIRRILETNVVEVSDD